MRFSARQQHCLQAMGIVPWVSRHAVDSEVTEVAEVAASSVATGVEFAAQPPESVDKLGEWLMTRALVPIHLRGSVFPFLGSVEATVLVVVEQSGSEPPVAALEGDSARLFTLMLRSIQLSARDTRQCVVSCEPVSSSGNSDLSVACTPQTRVVLMLMNTWPFDVSDTAAERHKGRLQGRLQGPELPLWRIAHPRLLLEQPLLKRQSWQVLKSLQAVLKGGGPL
jgi:hypothetical protein